MSDIPFRALASIPRLVLSLFVSYLKMKRRVRKSAKKMRRGLVKGGMSRSQAKALASQYEESVSIRKFIRGNVLGSMDIPFFG